MKYIMPFFVACALIAGTSCNTGYYSTDPDDLGTGYGLQDESGNANVVAETNNDATFDNDSTRAEVDSTAATAAPKADSAAAGAQADTAAH